MASTGGSSARTGRNGKVVLGGSLVARATKWRINPNVSTTVWADSDSEGYVNRKEGRHDCTGQITAKFDEDSKVYSLLDGSNNTVQGFVTSLALWETKTAKTYWAFPCALIENMEIEYDMDQQVVVEYSLNFGSDGKFYRPGQTGAPDYSLPS